MSRAFSLLFILMLPTFTSAAFVYRLPGGITFIVGNVQRIHEDFTAPQFKDISLTMPSPIEDAHLDFQSNAFIKPSEYLTLQDWTSLDYLNAVYFNVDRTSTIEAIEPIDFLKRQDEPKALEETLDERDMKSSPLPDSVSAVLSVFDFLKPLKHKTIIVTICFLIIAVLIKSFLSP